MKNQLIAIVSILVLTASLAAGQTFTGSVSTDSIILSEVNTYEIPAGTVFVVSLESEVSSANAAVNDTFTTTLVEPLIVSGILMLPAKTVIHGRISKVFKAARGGKSGKLEIVFDRIDLRNGNSREIKGEVSISKLLQGKSNAPVNAALVGGGIGIGAAVGAGTGGGSKSLIGGLFGGGIGIAAVLFTKGNEAILKANSKIGIEIKEKVVLPTTDY